MILEANQNLDELSTIISANTELDFKRYAEFFYDIFITGRTGACTGRAKADALPDAFSLLGCPEEQLPAFVAFLEKVTRRRPYLLKAAAEAYVKVIEALDVLPASLLPRLAVVTVLLTQAGILSPGIPKVDFFLTKLASTARLVDNGIAATFFTRVLKEYASGTSPERCIAALLRPLGLLSPQHMMNFLPGKLRTPEGLESYLAEQGLDWLVPVVHEQRLASMRASAVASLREKIAEYDEQIATAESAAEDDDINFREILDGLRAQLSAQFSAVQEANSLSKADTVSIAWEAIVSSMRFGGARGSHAADASRTVRRWGRALVPLCQMDARSQAALMLRLQDTCYRDPRLLNSFALIVQELYEVDALYEEIILAWAARAETSGRTGASVFVKQLAEFLHWLETAEEESED
jgi:hypothetical protein